MVLGVSAGAATADQLARVVASAAADGRHIAAILMADPDPADPNDLAAFPQLGRRTQLPTRMTGTALVTKPDETTNTKRRCISCKTVITCTSASGHTTRLHRSLTIVPARFRHRSHQLSDFSGRRCGVAKWVWRGMAVAGIVIGLGIAARLPVVYQASTSLLITPMSTGGEDSGAPITNEQAIADVRPDALAELDNKSSWGSRESANSFLASYTVTAPTDRVLVITVNAPSSGDAVNRANALATEYLQFRAQLVQAEQNLMISSLNQQIDQAKQNLSSIDTKISHVSAQPSSSAQQSQLANLAENRRLQATAALIAAAASCRSPLQASRRKLPRIRSWRTAASSTRPRRFHHIPG